MQLRGNPNPKDPNSHISRNRGGLLNIGRDWKVCDSSDVDIEAIKNDSIVRKDGESEERFAWFDVDKIGGESTPPKDEKPTKSDLLEQAEIEAEEDADIEAEVNRCQETKKDGEQCTRKALEGEMYCKIHMKDN